MFGRPGWKLTFRLIWAGPGGVSPRSQGREDSLAARMRRNSRARARLHMVRDAIRNGSQQVGPHLDGSTPEIKTIQETSTACRGQAVATTREGQHSTAAVG